MGSAASWLLLVQLLVKWMFLALWPAHDFETAINVTAELKSQHRDGPRAMIAAARWAFSPAS
jgi:hypothetical protein